MLSDEEMHALMAPGWGGGLRQGTVCGAGSMPRNARAAWQALQRWTQRYGIRTVNDAGAGDLCWRKGFKWQVEYRPFDLIPRDPTVTALDITAEDMPPCDLVLCRAVLNHLDEPRALRALERFKRVGRYLAATQYNREEPRPSLKAFWRLDLRRYLGPYLDAVPDLNTPDLSSLAIWDLHANPTV